MGGDACYVLIVNHQNMTQRRSQDVTDVFPLSVFFKDLLSSLVNPNITLCSWFEHGVLSEDFLHQRFSYCRGCALGGDCGGEGLNEGLHPSWDLGVRLEGQSNSHLRTSGRDIGERRQGHGLVNGRQHSYHTLWVVVASLFMVVIVVMMVVFVLVQVGVLVVVV